MRIDASSSDVQAALAPSQANAASKTARARFAIAASKQATQTTGAVALTLIEGAVGRNLDIRA